jgi:CheY-like chemotaxis protein
MILLIDDDSSFASDISALLEPRSDFVWTNRSSSGLALVRGMQPEHVLLDLDLPRHLGLIDEEEGLELLRRMSPDERSRVVVVTASLTHAVREGLEALGLERVYLKSQPLARLREMMAGASV